MAARTVIPWDKDDLDDLGFFKIDVLALGMLTAIRKALSLLHEATAPETPFDSIEALARVPPEDPVVYAAIQRADVIGVFQIESRAQMSMLPRLKPASFYDLVVEVAIVRPGPIQGGMVHPYLRRRTGQERPEPPHPCLKFFTWKRTPGVPLFQEQVMQIAMVGAGYTAGEADQLRRDMAGWRKTGRLERHRGEAAGRLRPPRHLARLRRAALPADPGFGEYGFPESHAASFALLVYASAWIKVHHPAEACLRAAQRPAHGILQPVVDRQGRAAPRRRGARALRGAERSDCTLETGSRMPALAPGLRQIRGSSARGVGDAIVDARAAAPFGLPGRSSCAAPT